MPKISFLLTPHISSVFGVNSPSIFPAFTLYTSGVPDKVCDFVGCSYTLHHKNRILVRFFLHIRKFFTTFATDSYTGGKYVLRKAFLKEKMRRHRTNLKFLRRRRRNWQRKIRQRRTNLSLLQIDSFLNCHKMVEYDG